jgi:hypothetical protein
LEAEVETTVVVVASFEAVEEGRGGAEEGERNAHLWGGKDLGVSRGGGRTA